MYVTGMKGCLSRGWRDDRVLQREKRPRKGNVSQKKEEHEGGRPYFVSPRHPSLQADSPAALPRVAACHWSADTEGLERDTESMKRE